MTPIQKSINAIASTIDVDNGLPRPVVAAVLLLTMDGTHERQKLLPETGKYYMLVIYNSSMVATYQAVAVKAAHHS